MALTAMKLLGAVAARNSPFQAQGGRSPDKILRRKTVSFETQKGCPEIAGNPLNCNLEIR
jgi:hypothetical protein